MREDHDRLTFHAKESLYNPISTTSDVFGSLATRAAIDKRVPSGRGHPYVGAGTTLVGAVVPLHEIVICNGVGAITSELTGHSSALQGAREHLSWLKTTEPAAQIASCSPTVVIKGNIAPAGMATRLTPRSLCVTYEEDLRLSGAKLQPRRVI